jgi:(1->4)-alpha-D-glucan 1-alpha-D-glucosylmutase
VSGRLNGAAVAAPSVPKPRRRRHGRVVPTGTYRLQLRPDFGFAEASAVAPYLKRLGVSHVYSSPYLQAAHGSTHGYDVVDPRRVNAELGGSRAHRRFCTLLGELGLGQVLDIVPNHMAIPGAENPWWWDVLENGQASRYAPTFDVDWDPPEAYLRNRILMPILGDHYGRVLEAGQIRLERSGGSFRVRYFEHVLPLAPPSLPPILTAAAGRVRSAQLAFLAGVAGRLPPSTATDRASTMRRNRDKEILRRLLARLLAEEPKTADAVDEEIARINADVDALDALLGAQNYRLAFWRAAGRDLGYRRFFDVSGLIGLRVEDESVFADTHGLILRWLAGGVLDGIRVDHPDGLRDPLEYLDRLRAASRRGWIIVEKILAPGERLRANWPVDGTTGYDFLNLVGGLFVDPAGEPELTALNTEITGEGRDFAAVSRECRLLVLRDTLGSELNRLTALLLDVCEGHRRYRDYTRHELHEALREVAAGMPVYRTYVRGLAGVVAPEDETAVAAAVAAARTARPDLDPALFGFLGDILSLRVRGDLESDLVMRFQQLTGAVMAKGVEDTAFYRYLRLTSLNEVGGDPGRFGVSVAEFHRANEDRLERSAATMLTTSTHDTKRGEDVRVRISALSEIPAAWAAAAGRWRGYVARHSRGARIDGVTEYLIMQTLAGTWPIDGGRLTAYLVKASREARLRTSWTAPDKTYERAIGRMVQRLLADGEFVADVEAFVAPIVVAGRVSSLSQALLRLTSPGVPDTYQGTELWDLSLVDPDNRRPVDFAARERLLGELESGLTPEAILARWDEGLPKLWTVHRALRLRRARPDLFDARGTYRPIPATGSAAEHVVAFVRGDGAVTIVPRLTLSLDGWGSTSLQLPAGSWHDELSGGSTPGGPTRLATLLARFPVALLVRTGGSGAGGR